MRSAPTIYHLPGSGIYGGIKVGYRFAALLDALGAPCVVATPDGKAAQWFRTAVPTICHADAMARLRPDTCIVFSYPLDYAALAATGATLAFHCQGTDPRIDPVIADPAVTVLTCWPQAAAYVKRVAGRDSVDVGIAVADAFFYDGTLKAEGSVAVMPRRGAEIVAACRRRNPDLDFVTIDGLDEEATARVMKRCNYFLATSVDEWFGLPAFEAMAAGAVVVSVPVIGGMDFLVPGENCLVAPPDGLAEALADLAQPRHAALRARLRHAGRLTAMPFLECRQRARVGALLQADLAVLASASSVSGGVRGAEGRGRFPGEPVPARSASGAGPAATVARARPAG